MTILQHLMILGITPSQLEDTLLPKEKIYELADVFTDEKKKKNYNSFDLVRISDAFKLSYKSIFTGIDR